MRRHRIGIFAHACLFAGWVAVPVAGAGIDANPALPPDVAATVNGQPIARHLVDVFLQNDREALGLGSDTDEERRRLAELPAAILDELVDRALIAQGVRERGAEPAEASIDTDERNLIKFCGGEERYAAYTAQSGFNRQEYRENVLRTAANGRAMIAALTHDLTVPADEIEAYYNAHHADADLQWPERVTGEHILINARPGLLASQLESQEGLAPDTAPMREAVTREIALRRERAETVRAEAAVPAADFAALARKESEDPGTRDAGGSLGTFAHGVHPPALDDAFFALKPGEIGPVVQTEFGFHVIHVSAHLPAGPKSLPDAAEQIRLLLMQGKSARRLLDWLAEARARANIVVRNPQDLPAPAAVSGR